jgi:hypothetical protein
VEQSAASQKGKRVYRDRIIMVDGATDDPNSGSRYKTTITATMHVLICG